jgi:hypothetical protein
MKNSFVKLNSNELEKISAGGFLNPSPCFSFYAGMFGAFTMAFVPVVGIALSAGALAYGISKAGACERSR